MNRIVLTLLAVLPISLPAFAAAPPSPVDTCCGLPRGAVARLGSALLRPGEQILALAISPDGKTIASAGKSGVRLWNVATGHAGFALTGCHGSGPINSVRYSADGTRLLAGSEDGHVCVWETRTGKALLAFRVLHDQRQPVSYDWSADGRRACAQLTGHCAEVWDVDRSVRLLALGTHPPPPGLTPSLGLAAQADTQPAAPQVPAPPAVPQSQKRPEPTLVTVALSPNGKHLASVWAVPKEGDPHAHELRLVDLAGHGISPR